MHGWHLLGARYHHNDWLFAIQITSLQTRCELSLYADLTYWNPTQTPNQLFQVSFEWKNLCCRRSVSNALLIFIVVVCSYFSCVCLFILHWTWEVSRICNIYCNNLANVDYMTASLKRIPNKNCSNRKWMLPFYALNSWKHQPLWARIELFEH